MKLRTSHILALGYSWERVTASFHNNFDNVTRHTDLLLEWDGVNATDYPLVINVQVVNKTSDRKANILELNITSEKIKHQTRDLASVTLTKKTTRSRSDRELISMERRTISSPIFAHCNIRTPSSTPGASTRPESRDYYCLIAVLCNITRGWRRK